MAIDNHMAIIRVQIDKKKIHDVLFDGGFRVNIVTKQLKTRLRLLKPKPIPCNLQMVDQTTTKLVGLIKDLRTYVHNTIHS